jgi:hypothetical protein
MDIKDFLVGFGVGAASGAAAVGGILKFVQHRGDIKRGKLATAGQRLLDATAELETGAAAMDWLISHNFRPDYSKEGEDLTEFYKFLCRMLPARTQTFAIDRYLVRLEKAKPFWLESPVEILNVWNASRWVIRTRWRWKFWREWSLLEAFPSAVEKLLILARAWYVEAILWKNHMASVDEWNIDIVVGIKEKWTEAYAEFLKLRQDIHNHVEPMAFA